MARIAKATERLRAQVNALYPGRDKSSDGWIGDEAHQARKSDHNPNAHGVVQALDITHDPKHGFDSYAFAEVLRARRDRRIAYIISNRKICSATVSPWEWRKYSGANPHDMHIHISVSDTAALYDDASDWDIGAIAGGVAGGAGGAVAPESPSTGAPMATPLLMRGDEGFNVKVLQRLLDMPEVDGLFGRDTEAAVRSWQGAHDLLPDGVVGPYAWRKLLEPKLAPDLDSDFHSIIGGWFCATPYDKTIPTSIRTNNPGALNASAAVAALPGFIGSDETSPGNKTAIFVTPEHGCAAWWDLLRRYREAGATTVGAIIDRYGGGQDYSAYKAFVRKRTGFSDGTEIQLGHFDQLLDLAKAMFRYEAGRETPLSDQQILEGFRLGRERSNV
jgi:peptidoglycan hydrolase-like protein with peptidoglycan-binding domain